MKEAKVLGAISIQNRVGQVIWSQYPNTWLPMLPPSQIFFGGAYDYIYVSITIIKKKTFD